MKRSGLFLFAVLFFSYYSVQLTAQVTNLTVNGVSANFTMVQGDSIIWEYNLPVGATADGEIVFDIDGNGVIDEASDKLFFEFTQTDGDTGADQEGILSDMDGQVDGRIFFALRVGLAPTNYVFRFRHNGVGQSVAGTVSALPSPPFTVSGNVTPPPGESAQYILVDAERPDEVEPFFWDALTDQNGDYTINFDAGSASSQWTVRVEDQFPGYTVTPAETTLTLSGGITGVNFVFTSVVFGDPDGDGNITAFDASLVLQHVVGLITFGDDQQLSADVDGDGAISAFDASLILQYVVGIITCFPAEPGCG